MPDVVVSSEDVTVLSGPSSINVDVNFGPKGDRGTIFHTVFSNPSTLTSSDFPLGLQQQDFAINANAADPEYLTVYQYYLQLDGRTTWIQVAKVIDGSYSYRNNSLIYTAGVSDYITIPVNMITQQTGTLSAQNFSIQIGFESANPIFGSITDISLLTVNNVYSIKFRIKAAQFSSSTVSALASSTPTTVHIAYVAI